MAPETAAVDLASPDGAAKVRHSLPTHRGRRSRARPRSTRAFERPGRAVETTAVDSSSESPFYFDPIALQALADEQAPVFAEGSPFPHVVLDGLFPSGVIERVLDEFPTTDDKRWTNLENSKSHRKQAIAEDWLLAPHTRHVMAQFNSAVFIEFLERLSGMKGLIPDPHYLGGGLQQIGSGGFLKIHTDVPYHKSWKLDRQLNVLLYMNKDWDEAWGGKFELWDDQMTSHKSVVPVFNRMVIFATPNAKHGHPDPLLTPEGTFRRAFVMHYYSNSTTEYENIGIRNRHYARPGEIFADDAPVRPERARRSRAREFLPPVFFKGAAKLRTLVSA